VNTSLGNNLSDDATGGGGPGDLINIDPLLAPLANYGGTTQTHALLPGSPAINAANNAAAPPTDQRGIARPQQSTADIGAFESQGFVLSLISGSPQSTTVSTPFPAPLIAGVVANDPGEPVDGGALTYTVPGSGASATLVTSPASIVGGQSSVTATANSTPGSYSVSVAASGATGTASFALTNAGTYTVGGTVSGLVGSGLVLQNNAGDDLAIAADGAFTFATALPDLSPYAVTVLTQPGTPVQSCSVANGSGTLAGANITNVVVSCVAVNAVVNSIADPGTGTCDLAECTLREAIVAANATAGLDTISFDPVVFGVARTITLTAGELIATQDLNLVGPGAALLSVSGNNSTRLMDASNVSVSISGVTLSGGNGAGSFNNGFGGAIHQVGGSLTLSDVVLSGNACSGTGAGGALVFLNNTSSITRTTISGNSCDTSSAISIEASSITIVDSTLSGNSATSGSALILRAGLADASLALTNVTISGNSSVGENSAIQSQAFAGRTASITLTNSTVSGNTTSNAAGNGAIWQRPSAGTHLTVLRNSIVAGNTVAGVDKDIEGTADAGSAFNVIGTGGGLSNGVNGNQVGVNNPLLAPLANYGGPTATRALLPGSPAINSGSNGLAPAADQRGIARPQLGAADVGAFESRGFVLSLVSGTPQTAAVNAVFAAPLVVALSANAGGEPVDGGQVLYAAPGAGASATVINPATISAGQASVTASANGIVGSYSVTATAAGATGTASFALSNGALATTTTISGIVPAVSVVGQPYTVSVSVLEGATPVTTGIVEVRQL
ncbi:MAG TPA: choice-of-anchor Q domain-containing protein, partial [Xanthomonadales bacterium]|nr:choice-of-anchor Q domain-containing protein [Xanthomonadales bacterium]